MTERSLLMEILDCAYDRKSWHGTGLRGSIRRLDPAQAAWRPAPRRKCIAEIVVHAAYWKYTVRRKLRGERRGSFPLKGSNWFALPEPFAAAEWINCIRLLDEQHQLLRAVLAGLRDADLAKSAPGSNYTVAFLLHGVAAHDLYHAGQIQTLKALQK